jgi:signal transduction histidine kinase
VTVSASLRRRSATRRSVVRLALTRFALLTFATLLILGAATALMGRHIAHGEAVRDARARSEGIARNVAAPIVDQSVRHRDPDAMRTLRSAMEARLRNGSVIHIVLWDTDGRILWAQDPGLVGVRFALTRELEDLALTGGSLLGDPGDREGHPGRAEEEDELLEVYVGARDADGVPFLFEAYVPPERLDQDYRAIVRELLPMSLGMLLLLQLSTLPFAVSLARRIDRTNAHRSTILKRSLQSWHEERRGLAQDLHDGVIQDLSAMSYALPAVIEQLRDGPAAEAARTYGRRMNLILERDLVALRSMVVGLAPAELDGAGLVAALQSLARQAGDAGLQVSLTVDPELRLGETAGGLVYRVVREGLRNVDKHAGATAVEVEVSRRGEMVEILVSDDGRGLPHEAPGEKHHGIWLLGRLAQDLGGTLSIDAAPQGGAALRVTIPVELPDLD